MRKSYCRNMLCTDYTAKDALQDLQAAIARGQRPLDPRNLESKTTSSLPKW